MKRTKNKDWIQGAVAKPGSLREYMIRKYGKKALDEYGRLSIPLLKKEYKLTKDDTIKRRINFALNVRKILNKKRKK